MKGLKLQVFINSQLKRERYHCLLLMTKKQKYFHPKMLQLETQSTMASNFENQWS